MRCLLVAAGHSRLGVVQDKVKAYNKKISEEKIKAAINSIKKRQQIIPDNVSDLSIEQRRRILVAAGYESHLSPISTESRISDQDTFKVIESSEFDEGYRNLRNAYIDTRQIFSDTSRLPFTGREWLLAEVDAFLEKHDRGYFILEANAGLGKTAFMVWLVQERGYIHNFCELTPGTEGVSNGLKNLVAQLALTYGVSALPDLASRPDYLYGLLKDVAEQIDEDEKIVIVVDALDEVGALNQNVMGLPMALPKGVYFIVSQRPASVTLNVKDPTTTIRYYYRFSAEDQGNQADMRRFLENAVEWPKIVNALQESESSYTKEQFITTLMDKCNGVWIYLYFVVQEISRGDRSPLDLATLPNGMAQYYARYWLSWRNSDETAWNEIYLPILTMLAASQEPLSGQRLIEWSSVDISERVIRRLLGEKWRPFLAITGAGQQSFYRFYHTTIRDFFDGNLDDTNLSIVDKLMIEELVEETDATHNRLADRYLKAWGGFDTNLEGLKVEELRNIDDQYGLRHLASHLEASHRFRDLHQLLRVEWIYPQKADYTSQRRAKYKPQFKLAQVGIDDHRNNAWYISREAVGQTDGYIADITRARRLAEEQAFNQTNTRAFDRESAEQIEWSNKNVGLQYRYLLILVSLRSYAENIWPGLLVELIKKNIWSIEQALVYARQVPSISKKVQLLAALMPILSDSEHQNVFQEALSLANSIKDGSLRAKALSSLAIDLSPKRLQEALSLARSIKYSTDKVEVLTSLAPHLSSEQVQEAILISYSIKDIFDRVKALASLAPHLSPEQVQETILLAHSIKDSSLRAKALFSLRNLSPECLQEALSLVHSIKDSSDRVEALASLAPHLPPKQVQEVISLVNTIKDTSQGAKALASLAPYLSAEHLNDVISRAHSFRIGSDRVEILTRLVPHLLPEQLQEVLRLVRFINDNIHRDMALAHLISHLSSEHSQEALALVRSIEHSTYLANALADLAPHLSSEQLQEALTLAHSITSSDRLKAFVGLVRYLSPEHMLSIIHTFSDSRVRASLLAITAPHLSLEQLQEALILARSIGNSALRDRALANLAPYLLPEQLTDVLLLAHSVKSESARSQILASLAPYLSEDQLQQTFTLARSIEIVALRDEVLASLAPYLSGEQLQEAFMLASSIEDDNVLAKSLTRLISHLSSEQLQEVLSLARSIENDSFRASVLVSLIPYLSQKQKEDAFLQTRFIDNNICRAKALASMAPHLTLEQLQEALLLIPLESYSFYRFSIMLSLVPHMSSEQLQGLLSLAHSIDDDNILVSILVSLTPYISSEQLQDVLSLVSPIKNESVRAGALISLAPYISSEQLQDVLSLVSSIKNISVRAGALISLAPYLSLEHLQKVLSFACVIENSSLRASVLKGLSPSLIKLSLTQLYDLWPSMLDVLASRTRDDLLSDLVALSKVIVYLGGGSTILEISQSIEDVGHWWP